MGINDHIGWIRTLDGFSGDLGITCLSIHLKPQTSLIAKGWGGRVAWGGAGIHQKTESNINIWLHTGVYNFFYLS